MTRFARCFVQSEEGTTSVEFVIVFPMLMFFFLSIVELGVLMTRQAMLDRGLDLAVREVRLGNLPSPLEHNDLRNLVCAASATIPSCARQIRLEMVPMNPRGAGMLDNEVDCVDLAAPADVEPVLNFTPGQPNELMLLRACVLFNPIFPTSGLGAHLIRQSGNAYALVSTSAFAIEPD